MLRLRRHAENAQTVINCASRSSQSFRGVSHPFADNAVNLGDEIAAFVSPASC